MVEEKIKNKRSLIVSLTAIGVITIIIFLIVLKINIPTFPLWQVILYSIILIVLGIAIYFFTVYLSKKNTNVKQDNLNGKLPPAITIEQAREMAISAVKCPVYADYVGKSCLGEKVFHLGKNIKNNIYLYRAKGLYENSEYYIMINMNYPQLYRTVIINPKNEHEIMSALMALSQDPIEESPIRTIINRNVLTGNEQLIQEKVNEQDSKENTKQEDDI